MTECLLLAELDWKDIAWGLLFSAAALVVSIAVVVLMPANYFVDRREKPAYRRPALRWTLLIAKNLLGASLLVLGVVMIFTPGQGVMTILIGIALLNFPGKRRLERRLIGRSGVLRAVNRLRARFGKPPVVLDDKSTGEAAEN
jgi:cobalamin synthase